MFSDFTSHQRSAHSLCPNYTGTLVLFKGIKRASTSGFLHLLFLLSWILPQSYLQYHFIRKAFLNNLFKIATFIILSYWPFSFRSTYHWFYTHTHTHTGPSFLANMHTPTYSKILFQMGCKDKLSEIFFFKFSLNLNVVSTNLLLISPDLGKFLLPILSSGTQLLKSNYVGSGPVQRIWVWALAGQNGDKG